MDDDSLIQQQACIVEEYRQLSLADPPPALVHLSPDDIAKNRWSNILPVAATRIRLGPSSSASSDYINANLVTHGSSSYICTQGPLAETCNDFWQMVYEQKSAVIVMLCNLVEKNRVRCHKYWPKLNEAKKYGDLIVKFVKNATMPGLQLRKFHLFFVGNGHADKSVLDGPPDRVVTQLHYTEWPDFGTPDSTFAIRSLFDLYNHYSGSTPGVIHCSAGIGRTGSFVAIHAAMRDLFTFGAANVRELTQSLRQQRAGMIQTAEQYLFVYQTLRDAILAQPQCKKNLLDSSGGDTADANGVLPMELEQEEGAGDVFGMLMGGRTFSCLGNSGAEHVVGSSCAWIKGQ